MERKPDRRVRRTRAQLRQGLAQLMGEKSVNEVTVTELVDLVDINRSTFYLHYRDIPHMLECVEQELYEQMDALCMERLGRITVADLEKRLKNRGKAT